MPQSCHLINNFSNTIDFNLYIIRYIFESTKRERGKFSEMAQSCHLIFFILLLLFSKVAYPYTLRLTIKHMYFLVERIRNYLYNALFMQTSNNCCLGKNKYVLF